jgi:hypothetical protein
LQNLILFPHVGKLQKAEGVRKIVTRKYPYLIYYMVDEFAESGPASSSPPNGVLPSRLLWKARPFAESLWGRRNWPAADLP